MTPLTPQTEALPYPQGWGELAIFGAVLLLLFGKEFGQAIVTWWGKLQTARIENDSKKEAAKIGSEEAEQKWHEREAQEARKRADAYLTKYLDRIEGENKTLKKSLEQALADKARYEKERNRFAQGFYFIQKHPERALDTVQWAFDGRYSGRLLDVDDDTSLPGVELTPSLEEITGELEDLDEDEEGDL